MYIIIYNGEGDFFVTNTKSEAETQIEALIQDGYAGDDIKIYSAKEISFEVKKAEIEIEIKD
jgi:hypothetical protein